MTTRRSRRPAGEHRPALAAHPRSPRGVPLPRPRGEPPGDRHVDGATGRQDGAYHGLALHWNGEAWTQVPVPGGIADFVAFASDDVYAAGSGIMHWDGTSWSVVETFPEVSGPAFAGLSATGPCELWAGGRRIDGSTLLPLVTRSIPPQQAPGDLDGDGAVGITDLLALLGAWGPCPAPCPPAACPADLDDDCIVGITDLLVLLANWS